MNNKTPLLSSRVNKMQGRQRIACVLELGRDEVIRLYKKQDNTLLFEAPVSQIMYSSGNLVKSRLRLSVLMNGKEAGARLGVWSINTEKSNAGLLDEFHGSATKVTARDIWIATLAKHGAFDNPKQPEEKIDKIGVWVLFGCLLTAAFVAASVMLMR